MDFKKKYLKYKLKYLELKKQIGGVKYQYLPKFNLINWARGRDGKLFVKFQINNDKTIRYAYRSNSGLLWHLLAYNEFRGIYSQKKHEWSYTTGNIFNMDIQAFLYDEQNFIEGDLIDVKTIKEEAQSLQRKKESEYRKIFTESICHNNRLEYDQDNIQHIGLEKIRHEYDNRSKNILRPGRRDTGLSTKELDYNSFKQIAEPNFKYLSILGCPMSVSSGYGITGYDGARPPAMVRIITFLEQFNGDEKEEYEKIVQKYMMTERSLLNPIRHTSMGKYYFDLSTKAIYTTTSQLISKFMEIHFSTVRESRQELFKGYFDSPLSLPIEEIVDNIHLEKIPFTMYMVNIENNDDKKMYTVFYITYNIDGALYAHPVAVIDSEQAETSMNTYECVINTGQYTCKIFEYYNQVAFGPWRGAGLKFVTTKAAEQNANNKRYVFVGQYTSGMYPCGGQPET